MRTKGIGVRSRLGRRSGESDKVAALDQGADDYLTKPFGMAELLARLRVMLRRARIGVAEQLTAGDVTIVFNRYLVLRDGQEVRLTPTEFDLLRVLASEAGRVLTHRQLLERVWGRYAAENTPRLRVYINYLRRKLEMDPRRPQLILTEPGVGYRLMAESRPSCAPRITGVTRAPLQAKSGDNVQELLEIA